MGRSEEEGERNLCNQGQVLQVSNRQDRTGWFSVESR